MRGLSSRRDGLEVETITRETHTLPPTMVASGTYTYHSHRVIFATYSYRGLKSSIFRLLS